MLEEKLFPTPTREEVRARNQKEFNKKQVSFAKTLGENTATIGCVLIFVLFIGYIWTDMKIQLSWERVICDAAASIAAFIMVEDLMSQNGIRCGKLYDEYIKTHEAYLTLKEEVIKNGLLFMDSFCEWQIESEYEAYIRRKCREDKIDYDDYCKRLNKMTVAELAKELGPEKATAVELLNLSKRIDLTPEMILTDDIGVKNERGGISIGAHDYVKKSIRGRANLIITIVTCVISAGISFYANAGASWGLVMYTVMKLALLCWRMYKGYSTGSRAYNTYEVKSLQDKMLYMNLYLEYIKTKKNNDVTGDYLHGEDQRQEEIDKGGIRGNQEQLRDNEVTV